MKKPRFAAHQNRTAAGSTNEGPAGRTPIHLKRARPAQVTQDHLGKSIDAFRPTEKLRELIACSAAFRPCHSNF